MSEPDIATGSNDKIKKYPGPYNNERSRGSIPSRGKLSLDKLSSYVDPDKDMEDIKTILCYYHCYYILIALYTSSYSLVTDSWMGYYVQVTGKDSLTSVSTEATKVAMFVAPFFCTGLFGLIGDYFYPCHYRFKPYIIFACLINLMLVLGLYFDLFQRNFSTSIILCIIFMLGLVLVQSIAQGITAVTSQLQVRIDRLSSFREEDSETMESNRYFKILNFNYKFNFCYFILVLGIGRAVFLSLSHFIQEEVSRDDNKNSSSFYMNFKILCICGVAILPFFALGREMKQTTMKNTRALPPFNTVFSSIFSKTTIPTLFACFFLTLNPVNYDHTATMRIIGKWESRTREVDYSIVSVSFATGGLVFAIVMIGVIACVRRINTNSYVAIIVLMQLMSSVSGLLFIRLNPNEIRSSPLVLLLILTMQMSSWFITQKLSIVCLVSELMRWAPKDYEVFYINILNTIISLAIGLSGLSSSILRYCLSIHSTEYTHLEYYAIFGILGNILIAVVYVGLKRR